ncbi:DUF2243 domain-containing protein [Aerosakkonema funiforme]|uniref:DUF2243 domain-containing protein n=1 Tax=Aerosakkonema funiforme FACHB-1375 TaxID=2949571 RepID=A0A926VI25_9CYAN|nr:DUF2243 domain-containing protein [Aerosakkonema funiforme]MBD2184095.1 DUF2243 domain-containing protein [Aerosakkonema funiforme FACHB-1375]
MDKQQNQLGSLIAAGVSIGMGAAGFFDGIVFHQILQWHHMLTNVLPTDSISDVEANTRWDGLFHAGMYVLTAVGIGFLWRASSNSNVPLSLKVFGGSLLIGAGSFNVVEGLINHQILGIHHVKPGPNQLAWDMGFLVVGALVAAIGWILLRSGQREVIVRD